MTDTEVLFFVATLRPVLLLLPSDSSLPQWTCAAHPSYLEVKCLAFHIQSTVVTDMWQQGSDLAPVWNLSPHRVRTGRSGGVRRGWPSDKCLKVCVTSVWAETAPERTPT